ncbi:hypothetical protein TNCV_5071701 [Trichonephila clavipes]|nr:hypothetical protein TNCV_5071701 [Trichonephila clavipes]
MTLLLPSNDVPLVIDWGERSGDLAGRAWRPRIIDTADTVVATPLVFNQPQECSCYQRKLFLVDPNSKCRPNVSRPQKGFVSTLTKPSSNQYTTINGTKTDTILT